MYQLVEKQLLQLKTEYDHEIQDVKMQNQILTKRIEGFEKVMQNSSFRSIGSIQIPAVVSFTAYATASCDYNAGDMVLFDGIVQDYGDFYNEAYGYFTCPANAYYLFSVHISNNNAGEMDYEIVVNGTAMVAGDVNGDWGSGSTSVMTYCEMSRLVWVRCINNNDRMYGGTRAYASFSGTLLFTV